MASAPWIVFVESNTSGTGRLFVKTARELGYEPLLLTRDAARYPFVAADAVRVRVVETDRQDALREAASALMRERPIAAVLSSSEYFLAAAATLARACRVPGPDPAAVERARDKGAQRDAFRRAGLIVPASIRVGTARRAREAAMRIGGSVIVKPLDGTGSIGVRLCTDLEEVERHAAALLSRRADERGRPVAGEILVEEYVDGREYSAELFNGRVVGLTRKHLSDAPFFVETGHDYPAVFPERTHAEIARTAATALQALGLGWGPAHVEFRMTASGPVIIEVNARLAGGFIPELMRAAQRIDPIAATLRLAIGDTPDMTAAHAHHASIRFLIAPGDGRITAIAGLDEARRQPGVLDVQAYHAPGDWIGRHHDFRDRIGHAMAVAPHARTAADAACRARDAIRIAIEPHAARPAVKAAASS